MLFDLKYYHLKGFSNITIIIQGRATNIIAKKLCILEVIDKIV